MPTLRSASATKPEVGDDAAAVVPVTRDPPRRESKVPVVVKFPLAVILSFAMSTTGYSLLGEVTKGELASVSRSQDTWGEVGLLAGWRV